MTDIALQEEPAGVEPGGANQPYASAAEAEDPNAVPAPVILAASAPAPVVEAHEPTGTTLLHYHADSLDAATVTRLARDAGHDVIGAPDHLDIAHWRIQVRNPKGTD